MSDNYDCVIHCACFNAAPTKRAELFWNNNLMNNHVIQGAVNFRIKKLFVFASTDAFSKTSYPLTEDCLQTGFPFGNHPFHYAQRMADIQIGAVNTQYGTNYCTIIPSVIYGIGSDFNLEKGKVIPKLIHQAYVAKQRKEKLILPGVGTHQYEIIHADDLAEIIIRLAEKEKIPHDKYLIGGTSVSVGSIVKTIADVMDIDFEFNSALPTGRQWREPIDPNRLLNSLGTIISYRGWTEELIKIIRNFINNYNTVRK
jgi:GDP-L-fucose synthase